METSKKVLITAREFSELCSCSMPTVWRMIKNKKIRVVRLSSSSIKIPYSEIERLISENGNYPLVT